MLQSGMRDAWVRRMTRWAARWPLALDGFLAVLACAATVLPLTADEPDCDCVVTPWAFVTAAGMTLPLTFRRRAPFLVNLAIAPFALAFGFNGWPSPLVPIGPLVALHAVAAYARVWQSLVCLATSLLAVPLMFVTRPYDSEPFEAFNLTLVVFVAWLAGVLTRSQRAVLQQYRRRVVAERARRRAEAARAVAEERNLIAREMHDLLGHSVGVMVVLAEGGAAATEGATAGGTQAFDLIARTGRETLADLRRLLGTVRAGDDEELRPLPTTADIPKLVDTMRQAGVDVTLDMPQPRVVAGAAGLAAFRIVQESLTNALKHAPGRPVAVDVRDGAEELTIEVRNPVPAGAGRAELGHGLRGMLERAASVGAALSYGAEGGTWTVRLKLGR